VFSLDCFNKFTGAMAIWEVKLDPQFIIPKYGCLTIQFPSDYEIYDAQVTRITIALSNKSVDLRLFKTSSSAVGYDSIKMIF